VWLLTPQLQRLLRCALPLRALLRLRHARGPLLLRVAHQQRRLRRTRLALLPALRQQHSQMHRVRQAVEGGRALLLQQRLTICCGRPARARAPASQPPRPTRCARLAQTPASALPLPLPRLERSLARRARDQAWTQQALPRRR
jgi:hypothetical protein